MSRMEPNWSSKRRALKAEPRCAFTLLELLGVLAVLAILAAAATPAVLRQMDQAARANESLALSAITNALVLQLLGTNASKTIPSELTWAQAVASWTRQPVARITTTPRGYTRVYLIDTNGWFGTSQFALPYTNTTSRATNPGTQPNLRLMVLSRIAGPDFPVTSGKPGNSAFNDIWSTPAGSKPSTWTTSWTGKGQDLLIQRLNLEPYFHRLILVNRDKINPNPTLAVDTSTAVQITTNGWDAYYLDGSAVSLGDASGTPMLRFPLSKDQSWLYDGGWSTTPSGDSQSSRQIASDFADLAAQFQAAQWYQGSNQSGRGDQQGALMAMYNLMLVFSLWANESPHFATHNSSSATAVPEYQLLNNLVGSSSGGASSPLLEVFTGANGLLAN